MGTLHFVSIPTSCNAYNKLHTFYDVGASQYVSVEACAHMTRFYVDQAAIVLL